MTSDEKAQIRAEFTREGSLSPALSARVKAAALNGEKHLLKDDEICCKWRDTVGPITYTKTDTDTCENILLGEVTDDSNCT